MSITEFVASLIALTGISIVSFWWMHSKHEMQYVIRVAGLNPLYLVAGFNAFSGGRAFLISSDIQNFEELMTIFAEHRPDLFRNEERHEEGI